MKTIFPIPIISLSGLLLVSASLHAQQGSLVGWHPNMVTEVGRGLDWYNQAVTKPLVVVMPKDFPPYSGTGSADLSASFAQHQLDLVRAFSVNMSASLESLVGSGNVGFSFVDNQSFSQNTITFAFVATRNFGSTLLQPVSLDQDFVSYVNLKKQSLSGTALHQAIVNKYGTHFITGYSSAASIYVIYNFEFGSSSVAQSFSANISGQYGGILASGDFQSTVQSALQQNETRVALHYQIHTSDPIKSFPNTSGTITSFPEYTNLLNQLTIFANDMSPTNAQKTGWILQPLEDVPGYLSLVGDDSPTSQFDTSYERFLQIYAPLKSWDRLLTGWSADPRRMGWLNAAGQAQVIAIRHDVDDYVQTLEQIARNYFATGASLIVPDDALSYLATFNRIKVPTINTAAFVGIGSSDGRLGLIGYINCGSISNTVERPFGFLHTRLNAQDIADVNRVYYSEDLDEFVQGCLGSGNTTFAGYCRQLFATTAWQSLTQSVTGSRLGFFSADSSDISGGTPDTTTLALKDAAGNVVEEVNFLAALQDPPANNFQADFQTDLAVSLANPSPATNSVGKSAIYSFTITNNGPGLAYGVKLMLPLATNIDFVSVTGSQGQGGETNGIVSFNVGPLAGYAKATVALRFVPLVVGQVLPAKKALLTLGPGLSESNPVDNVINLVPLTVVPLSLGASRSGNFIELTWQSDSDRLAVETTDDLRAAWQLLGTTGSRNNGNVNLQVTPKEQQRFFRLNVH